MKFTVSKDTFLAALGRASQAIPKKSSIPLLFCVHILATDEGLVLRGTDLYQWITLPCPAEVAKPGSMLVPAKALKERVDAMPNDDLTFEVKKDQLTVSRGSRKSTIRVMNADDAPPVPKFEGMSVFKGPSELLLDLLAFTAHAMSEDGTRVHLHGVLLEMDDAHLRGVSTDGHRLAFRERVIEGGRDWDALIPFEPAKVVAKLAKELALDVEILSSSTSVAFKFGELVYGTKLTDGKAPPYRQVLPNLATHSEAKVARSELVDCVRSVALAAEVNGGVVLAMQDGELTISAKSPENGESEDHLAVEFTGTAEVKISPGYLKDSLGAYDSADLVFYVRKDIDPLVLGPPDARCLVMPMRL